MWQNQFCKQRLNEKQQAGRQENRQRENGLFRCGFAHRATAAFYLWFTRRYKGKVAEV